MHNGETPQSTGYDIGPDEDRNDSTSRTTSGGDLDLNGFHDRSDFSLIGHPSVDLYEEVLDETPSVCTNMSNTNSVDQAYYFEINRLGTFEGNWQDNYVVCAIDLAKEGFIYIGPGDKVKCVFCLKSLWNWEIGDSVPREHEKHYPNCPFVRGKCQHLNVPTGPLDNNRYLGLHMKTDEQNLDASSVFSDCQKTYKNWPRDAPVRSDALAEAGLKYVGKDDHVECFSCHTLFTDWQPGDDPWFEHVKWSPSCPYVQSVKGMGFIRDVKRKLANERNNNNGSVSNQVTVSQDNKNALGQDNKQAVGQDNKQAVGQGNKQVVAQDSKPAVAQGNKQAVAQENNQAVAHGNKQAVAQGNKQAVAQGNKQVAAQENNQIVSHGNKQSVAQGNKHAVAQDNKQSVAQGNKQVVAQENNQAVALGNKQPVVLGNKQPVAQGNKQPVAQGNTQAVAQHSKQAVAQDNKQAVGQDNKQAVAQDNKQAVPYSKEDRQYAGRPQEVSQVKPTPQVLSLEEQIEIDLRIPAVKAVIQTCDTPLDQIIQRLRKIRLTKGLNYIITTVDFADII